jgi:hypothetical protein
MAENLGMEIFEKMEVICMTKLPHTIVENETPSPARLVSDVTDFLCGNGQGNICCYICAVLYFHLKIVSAWTFSDLVTYLYLNMGGLHPMFNHLNVRKFWNIDLIIWLKLS